MWRKVTAWLAISVVLFGASAWLTEKVTSVDGHSPFDFFNPKFGKDADGNAEKTPFHGQLISILTPEGEPDPGQVRVYYKIVNFGEADIAVRQKGRIHIQIAPHQALKILLNHIQQDGEFYACNSTGDVPVDATSNNQEENIKENKYVFGFDPARMTVGDTEFGVITVAPQDNYFSIYCWVMPDVAHETFVTRSSEISFFEPGGPMANDNDSAAWNKMFDKTFPGYRSVSSLAFGFEVKGSNNFRLDGGRIYDEDPVDSRIIGPGQYIEADWEDVLRQQLRDIFLIIIGTLIAIGVTTLIEAFRPLIDGEGKV